MEYDHGGYRSCALVAITQVWEAPVNSVGMEERSKQWYGKDKYIRNQHLVSKI